MILTKRAKFRQAAATNGISLAGLAKYLLVFGIIFGALFIGKDKIPVVVFEQAEIVSRTKDSVILDVSAIKFLDCGFVPGSAAGWVRHETGRWKRVQFEFIDDETPDNSVRAKLIRQAFGLWSWSDAKSRVDGPVVESFLLVQHICGDYETDDDGLVIVEPDSDIRFTSVGSFELDKLEPAGL